MLDVAVLTFQLETGGGRQKFVSNWIPLLMEQEMAIASIGGVEASPLQFSNHGGGLNS